jgi:two-component system, chemotaxis family, response regulator Rcp1
VLIIEDNLDDEMMLMHMLQKARLDGHIEVVRDGKQALEHLTRDEAKVENLIALFLDLNIPTINGLQLLAMIRADDRLLHLPVIVMTSSNSPQDLQECKRLRVASYVAKPLSMATFTKAIADVFHMPSNTIKPLEKAGLVE